MKRCVIDASVAAKWFLPEAHAELAERLLAPEVERLAPDLIRAELSNVLWKKVRMRDLRPEDALRILKGFHKVPMDHEPIGTLAEPALNLALETDRTVYDCLYLALAIARDCRMITADRRLTNALACSPFADHVLWVGDLPELL